ncbi:MAG: ATP-dependent 6-phosphofructokinase [Candidatus Heimdallarchaeota archaeon]|nr:MAG: ATP-dependent 6-phosphofructokinase [Candidatus Heimdallarchaeota archaeon]
MKKTIGVLTGGGDCPGLNSVLYGILLKAMDNKHTVIGIEKGWKGYLQNLTRELEITKLDDLHTIGGTILYTSRTNPYKEAKRIKDPTERQRQIEITAKKMASQFKTLGIDALIAIGGDDTLGVAAAMHQYAGAKIVGVPKTIDNDLSSTDYTFGFWSAIQLASNTMDNITTTSRSHQRIFVVEVMGRDAGWLTLVSGISTGADIILIPERPFDFETDIVNVLKERVQAERKHHIIACSEGAVPTKESLKRDFKTITAETIEKLPKDDFGNPLLSKLNMSKIIVRELSLRDDLKTFFRKYQAEFEVRDVVLGHTMRAGTPSSFDRILGLRLGAKAAQLVQEDRYGLMVCLHGENIETVTLTAGAKKKLVPLDSDLLELRDLITRVKCESRL